MIKKTSSTSTYRFFFILLISLSSSVGFAKELLPLRWGVDDAGTKGRLLTHPKGKEILEEFDFNFLVTHHLPKTSVLENRDYIRSLDKWCQEAQVEWVANLESANFRKQHIDDQGKDWFNQADGRHFWLVPQKILEEYGRCKNLWGVMYDEAAHMQNCRNMIAKIDAPWIFDPKGYTLKEAESGFVREARKLRDVYAKHGIRLSTEHVFPVLFHSFANAGWTAGTKILKEGWSPAYIACALGAALQYDTELWISPDLWHLGKYPGHSPDAYRSALLLAYHMGADCIYTENLAFQQGKNPIGSLVKLTKTDYELTEYGEITKWFGKEYMPNCPRTYSFRDVKPRVAIIRQPDACWGQSGSWLPDTLFGHKEWPSTPDTEAWLKIWHLLSRGVVTDYTLSWQNSKLKKSLPYQVFCPLDGVVVFDHRVGQKPLEGVEVIFLTGLGVTKKTQDAVRQSVLNGATCIALPHLLPKDIRQATEHNSVFIEGKGSWVATTDFMAPHVQKRTKHIIPTKNEIRYRFGEKEVIFEPQNGDPNNLKVTTTE